MNGDERVKFLLVEKSCEMIVAAQKEELSTSEELGAQLQRELSS